MNKVNYRYFEFLKYMHFNCPFLKMMIAWLVNNHLKHWLASFNIKLFFLSNYLYPIIYSKYFALIMPIDLINFTCHLSFVVTLKYFIGKIFV